LSQAETQYVCSILETSPVDRRRHGYARAMTTDEPAAATQPEYGGECAFAVSLNKSDSPESGKHQMTQDGRTFYFKNGVAKFLFKALNRTGKADQNWAARTS